MKPKHSKTFMIYFTEKEYAALIANFEKSTCQSLSEYGRKVMFGKPIIFKFRNQALDEILEELVTLRTHLKGVRENFDEAIEGFHAGSKDDSLESIINQEVRPSIAQIMDRIAKFSDIWSQNSALERA